MPCEKCGTKLLLWETLKCPVCEDHKVLNLEEGKIVSKKRIEYFNDLWEFEIRKYDKYSILAHFTWNREKICRKFFQTYSTLDLGEIFSTTLFLKRVMKIKQNDNAIILRDEEKAEKLSKIYKDVVKIETDDNLLKNELASIVAKKNYDLNNISGKESFENFHFLHNEDYVKLMKSYENYNLLDPQEAEQKIEEYREEAERLMNKNLEKVEYTTEQFIEKNYDIICTLYIGLIRNRIFKEAFDLTTYGKLLKNPRQLITLVNQYNAAERGISGGPTNEFLMKAKKIFPLPIGKIKEILIFEEENSKKFPLFIRTLKSEIDYVLISHRFSFIVYVLLHAIISKDLFEKEQSKRGSEFEKQVQELFENNGFIYKPNIKTKHLEIDGIAIKNSKCYIIEVKKYRLPTLVEEKNRRENTIRDLKGIVEGKKFSFKDGNLGERITPSLQEKIDFVTNNFSKVELEQYNIELFKGLIITIDYPWISEYKGIDFFAFNEIKEILENQV
jgi:hypothetical protein